MGRDADCAVGLVALKAKIAEHGVRNSLLLAPMPTSTAQILGNNECFEPYVNICRRTPSGEFAVVNQHLLRDLMSRGLWTAEIRNQIIAHNCSAQHILETPTTSGLYRTSWEIKQRALIDMAADRGAFIDQSQSFNVFVQDPNYELSSMPSGEEGPQDGMYYLRTKAASDAIKFTVDQESLRRKSSADALKASGNSSLKESGRASPTPAPEGPPEPEECLACGA